MTDAVDDIKRVSVSPRAQKPAVIQVIDDAQVKQMVNNLVEISQLLAGQSEDKLERAVTFKDLAESGFKLSDLAGFTNIEVPIPDVVPDPTTPPDISGLSFSATFNNVLMFWDAANYGNHAYVEIFKAPAFTDEAETIPTTIDDAYFSGNSTTTSYADPVFQNTKWRYWLRNVSTSDVKGNWSSVDGDVIEVPISPSALLEILTGEIKKSDLYVDLQTDIDKIQPVYDAVLTPLTGLMDIVKTGTTNLVTDVINLQYAINDPTTGLSAKYDQLSGAINDPSTGLITALDSLELAIYNPVDGVIAKHDALDAVVNDPTTGLIASISSLDLAINDPTTGVDARLQSLDSLVTSPNGVQAQAAQALSIGNTAYSTANTAYNTAYNANTTANSAWARAGTALTLSQNNEGKINAAYTVKLNVNGYVSGIGLMNTGETSAFGVVADRFWVAKPGSSQTSIPFVVDAQTGQVVMSDAYIRAAYIEQLVASKVTADYVNTLQLNAVNITGGTISIGNNFQVNGAGNLIATSADLYQVTIRNTQGQIMMTSSGIVNVGAMGLGAMASINQLTAANISTYMGNAAVDTLYIAGNAVTAASNFGMGTQTTGNYNGASVTLQSSNMTVTSNSIPATVIANMVVRARRNSENKPSDKINITGRLKSSAGATLDSRTTRVGQPYDAYTDKYIPFVFKGTTTNGVYLEVYAWTEGEIYQVECWGALHAAKR